jgi:hypothetical protein
MAEVYTPPLANPSPGGLYSVAALIDITGTSRLAEDVVVETWNCGPSWVLPIHCEDDFPDPSPMGAEPRNDWLDNVFEGDVVGADDDCSALVNEPEAGQRAQQLLRLQEPVNVEKQLVPRLLAMAGTPTSVTGLVAAVGALEESVAEFGFTGVIHAAPHLAAALQNAQLITRSGQYLLSPSGHRWAFGSGYTGLNETLVATGPVTVQRGAPVLTHAPDYTHNQRLSTVQRDVLVLWECWTKAVTIGA